MRLDTAESMERPRGVVSAASPEAAAAGARVLDAGGNAVDAAVAVSLVLGVTEPAGSGIGGQSTFIVHAPGEAAFVVNGTSLSPEGTPLDATLADLTGYRASTVPSTLRVLDFVHRRFGSGRVDWARLVEPAVRYAREGYAIGPFRHKALQRYSRSIRRNGVATRLLLGPKGAVPEVGDRVRTPLLGETLARIAGAGAEDFYRGEIARRIADDMRFNEGWITLKDLNDLPEPAVLPAVKGTYRKWDVHTLPPPAAGWVVLMALNILEEAPQGLLATEGAGRLAWLADTLVAANRQRAFRPVADLIDYEEAVAEKASKKKAKRIVRSLFRFGTGETTHFSVADASGMMVGVTQSLNSYYGARVSSPKLGFLYNDYMREFIAGAHSHPFALRPGAMPYSSMSATVLSKEGEPILVLGSPGDLRIISAVVQVISHWVDVGAGIEAAVHAPRLHVAREDEVLLETRPGDLDALLHLELRGFSVLQPMSSLFSGELNPYFGGVHAVAKEEGRLVGAADPRRDGAVVLEGGAGRP